MEHKEGSVQPVSVLHAVEDMRIGGMERVIASIVTGLNREKYAVHVLSLARGGAVADELIEKGVPVTILKLDNYHRPEQILTLCRWLRRNHCHILHVHGYYAGVLARISGLLAGIPYMVYHVHSTYAEYQNRHLLMERILSRWTDRIVCVSRAVQEWVVAAEKIDRGKTAVIYNGVGPTYLERSVEADQSMLRRELGIPSRSTVFAAVASLKPNKGHEILLESFKIILDSDRDAMLLIVGDGPLRAKLEDKARALAIDQKVFFVGNRTDVHRLLQLSDVCVLPSRFREGLSMSLIEAMAVGLPLIGTNVGGIPEVINDGENGFLVPPERPAELANAMAKIVLDRNLRIRMGKRSRQMYEEKFTLSDMIRRVESLYNNLTDN